MRGIGVLPWVGLLYVYVQHTCKRVRLFWSGSRFGSLGYWYRFQLVTSTLYPQSTGTSAPLLLLMSAFNTLPTKASDVERFAVRYRY
jgi:hypothetical protein